MKLLAICVVTSRVIAERRWIPRGPERRKYVELELLKQTISATTVRTTVAKATQSFDMPCFVVAWGRSGWPASN